MHRLLSQITIDDAIDSSERGMDPVAMTLISHRKIEKKNRASLRSNPRPPGLELFSRAKLGLRPASTVNNVYKTITHLPSENA